MTYLLQSTKFFQLAGLAIICGGILIIGAVTAPLVFGSLDRPVAAELMIKIFGRFENIIKYSVFVVFVFKVIEIFLLGLKGDLKSIAGYIAVALLFLVTSYIVFFLSPQLGAARGVDEELFDKLHKLSEKLYKLDFLLALISLGLA